VRACICSCKCPFHKYDDGDGRPKASPKDFEIAKDLLEDAYRGGHAQAAVNLSFLYEQKVTLSTSLTIRGGIVMRRKVCFLRGGLTYRGTSLLHVHRVGRAAAQTARRAGSHHPMARQMRKAEQLAAQKTHRMKFIPRVLATGPWRTSEAFLEAAGTSYGKLWGALQRNVAVPATICMPAMTSPEPFALAVGTSVSAGLRPPTTRRTRTWTPKQPRSPDYPQCGKP
jgi:hypothetical protein